MSFALSHKVTVADAVVVMPPWTPGEESKAIKTRLRGMRGIREPVAPTIDRQVEQARRSQGVPPPPPPGSHEEYMMPTES